MLGRAMVLVALLAGCSDSPCECDAGAVSDGGRRADAAAAGDAGVDAAPSPDAGATDAGVLDAGTDAGELSCPGLQVWTWEGETLDATYWGEGSSIDFAEGEWYYDTAFAAGQLRADATHAREPGTASIRAYIDPLAPLPPGAMMEANYRAEIARRPWHELVPVGTELWIGWSYYLPPTYVQDTARRAALFQLHAGRNSPPIEIAHWVPADYSGRYGSQLHIVRRWGGYLDDLEDHGTLPITLEPDHWYDFVMHVVWDVEEEGTRGLTELWVNGTQHYSVRGGNTYSAGTDPGDLNLPYGGTPKLGWYKYPWRTLEGVEASAAAGVTELEMFIGAVRIVRHPEGEHLGARGYDCVAPRGARP